MQILSCVLPAVSLGGETIIYSPADASREKMAQEERNVTGITGSLFRLSAGSEDRDDLLKNSEEAL